MNPSRVQQFAFVGVISTVHFYTCLNNVSLEARPAIGFQIVLLEGYVPKQWVVGHMVQESAEALFYNWAEHTGFYARLTPAHHLKRF
jgi:hypothetical protein